MNTDRELWREVEGDYYAPRIFVTAGGGIGIEVGGLVYVKPVRDWHALATPPCKVRLAGKTDPPQDCDWPFCGCDPRATKVIEALQECDMLKDRCSEHPNAGHETVCLECVETLPIIDEPARQD